jgi:Fe2+ or Zn2+ uptake regulation protein
MNTVGIIKKAGLKATLQRKIVYEVMTELRHTTMDKIIAKVRIQHPEITISTIYRILDAFCETKIISKIKHPDGKDYYDVTSSAHHHLFVNDEVIDYIDPELTELIKNNLKGDLWKHLNLEKIAIQIVATPKKIEYE